MTPKEKAKDLIDIYKDMGEIPKDNEPNQIYVLSGKVGYFKVKNNKWELIGLRKPEGVTDNDIITLKESNTPEIPM